VNGTADLRVVILAYGEEDRHTALIETLLPQEVDPASVLVVHNPSCPGQSPPGAPAGCEVLQASHNLGYAAGMNLGIRRQLRHDPRFLLLLTHDARLRPGAVKALLRAAAEDRGLGALGPVLMLPGGDEPFSYGGRVRRDGTVEHVHLPPASGGITECDWIDGGIMLLRAEAMRRLGGFDERFWSYCEEAELCLRVRRGGFRVAVVLDAEAEQSPGSQQRPGAWSYLMTRNGAAYARRARGLAGLTGFLGWTALLVVKNLARVALRVLRLRSGSAEEPWVLVVGMSRGAGDYFRRRWGPPPAGLPGGGDIGNTAPPSRPADG
jgi:N-acetylglucosaminyl-diphospho-decaprenol L-rhamnosyltransferase